MKIDDRLTGIAAGAALSFVLAALLVPVRGQVSTAVAALMLVLPVVLGSVLGGRSAGATTAVVATLCFDFIFTVPYGSLKMSSGDDVEAAGVLLVLALIVGTVSARERRSATTAAARQGELTAVYRIAALVVDQAPVDTLVKEARSELAALLGLERCDFVEIGAAGALPQIEHSGRVPVTFHRYIEGGFELPIGARLPARGPAGTHGYFVLFGSPGVPVPIERRRAGVVIADLVGTAMEAEPV